MITMIGGEMPEYAEQHPPADGPLYRHLLDRLPTGIRVLVAGPHHTGLIRALADRREVTCLLRSRPDAEALPDVDVLCGTLSKLTETDRYDVVVALDGVGRLVSPEDTPLDWAESVRVLKRALRPGGTLLLAVENKLGVHRLVDPGTATADPAADAWTPLGEFSGEPGRPDRLTTVLGAEGLPVTSLMSGWPSLRRPSLLATPEALRYGPLDALSAFAAHATAGAYAEIPVLSDPRRLAAASVRRGIGAELAPVWLVTAQRAARPSPALPLPPVLFASPDASSPVVTELLSTPDGWLRRPVNGPAEPLPAGHLLEERLLTAALGHDLPQLRRLLTGWMTELPMAAAGNVLVDGERFTILDPGVPELPDALARFAHTLLDGGYHHPWPGVTDVVRLIAVLAGAAGVSAPPDISEMSVSIGRREQEAQLTELRQRLADAEERTRFFEVELEKREAELGRAKTQIAAFSGNLGYRAAKAGLILARAARNRIRKGRT